MAFNNYAEVLNFVGGELVEWLTFFYCFFQLSYRLKHVRGIVRVISLGETLITCFAGIL